jgi:hypothetical protein
MGEGWCKDGKENMGEGVTCQGLVRVHRDLSAWGSTLLRRRAVG